MDELVRTIIEVAVFVILAFAFSAVGFFFSPTIGNALLGILIAMAFLRGLGVLRFSKKKE